MSGDRKDGSAMAVLGPQDVVERLLSHASELSEARRYEDKGSRATGMDLAEALAYSALQIRRDSGPVGEKYYRAMINYALSVIAAGENDGAVEAMLWWLLFSEQPSLS